jgi:hypothetical protein
MCANVSNVSSQPTVNVQTFAVVLSRRASVESTLLAIAKRASRRGLPVPTWTWGKVTTETETHTFRHETYTDQLVEREVRVSRIERASMTRA